MPGNENTDLSALLEEQKHLIETLKAEKASLLRVISHDIKSPFNQLFALIQLFELEGENLGERQKEYIDKMYHAVISGIEMIQNLQDFRSIDEHNLQVSVEKLDVANILNKLVTRYQIQARLNKVRIQHHQNKESIAIHTDEILILKVLEKILSNAIKYSGPGTMVEIEAEETGSEILLRIKDEGPGLTRDELSFIYEPFRSLSAKPTTGGGTTGLGMFIARQIAEVIGAHLTVKSGRKSGLVVSLTIPKN